VNRARAAWIAAALVVLAALGYLVQRRRRQPAAAIASPPPTFRATPAPPVGGPTTTETAAIRELPMIEEQPVPTQVTDVADDTEKPLPTWVRVAIIAVALVAFFAVSLIATKQV
jgi:hypothetical protein